MQHEVQTDLTGVHHLLGRHAHLLNIAVLIEALNDGSAVEPRNEEVDVACSLPGLLSDHLFGLVADVVDGSGEGLAGIVAEGVEDGDGAHIEILDHLIVPGETVLGVLEPKLGLTHSSRIHIHHVVVVNDAVGILAVGLLVAVTDEHELAGLGFPDVGETEGEVVDVVGLSSGVVDLDSGHLGVLGVGAEVEVAELDLSLVLVAEPGDHGVVVGTLDGVLVGPLVLDGLELSDGLAGLGILGVIILIVGEPESGVIEGALLDYHEHLGVVEGLDVHLGDVVEEVFVVDVADGFGLEVDDVDVGLGDVHDDDFALVEHSEEVDDVGVLVLEEDLAVGVDVHDTLIGAGVDHSREDEGVVEGRREAQDLRHLVLQHQLVVVLQQHIFPINQYISTRFLQELNYHITPPHKDN